MMCDGIQKLFFNLKECGLSATISICVVQRRPLPADSPCFFGLKKEDLRMKKLIVGIVLWIIVGISCLHYDWIIQDNRDLTLRDSVLMCIAGTMSGPFCAVFVIDAFDDVMLYKHSTDGD